MRRLMPPALALAAAIGLALPAAAADLLPPAPPLAEAVPVQEIGSGWYLRGDVGYATYGEPTDSPYGATTDPKLLMRHEKIEDTASIGIGVGYRLNGWLRFDVTADHRFESQFSGYNSGSNFVIGQTRGEADFASSSVLANAYVDLGTWAGITPYLGAGIGFASNTFSNYVSTVEYFDGRYGGPPIKYEGMTRTGLAWALMAGVGVQVGHGGVLDLGYRYVNLGEAATKLDQFRIGTKIKDIEAHEFRVGLRWHLDRPAVAAAVPVHAPIVTRY